MAYQALYRQWRPKSFHDVVGQDAIISTLRRQVATGRISHAYLFSGTRGTGKTTTAQILSKAINCLAPMQGDPCGTCANCVALSQGMTLDIEEIDAASNNGVEEIRSLRDKIQYPPQAGKYRVYIIDEVHMLSTSAFNALLKTLEEPPAHAVMILATTEPQKLPATILSRCQRFDFKRIPAMEIADRLERIVKASSVVYDRDALMSMARSAEGGMRDAIGLLDLCMVSGDKITLEMVEQAIGTAGRDFLSSIAQSMGQGDLAATLTHIDHAMQEGRDAAVLARDLSTHMRNLTVLLVVGAKEGSVILEISPEEGESLQEQAQGIGQERLLRALELFSKVEPEMRWAAHPRTLLELAAVKACRPEGSDDLSALLQRIEQLEKKIQEGTLQQPLVVAKKQTLPLPPTKEHVQSETPAATTANGDPASVWKEALAAVKSTNIALFSALRRARLTSIVEGVAQVAFSPEDDVFYKMLLLEANTKVLQKALSDAAGREQVVRVSLAGQQADMPEPVVSTAKPSQAPWVQQAVDLFGRENIDILEKG